MLLGGHAGRAGLRGRAISTHLDEALGLAKSLDIDFALLDINLDGHQSFPVADVLRERGVPFLFATGYGAKILKPPYAGTPTLPKPFQLEDLRRVIGTLTAA